MHAYVSFDCFCKKTGDECGQQCSGLQCAQKCKGVACGKECSVSGMLSLFCLEKDSVFATKDLSTTYNLFLCKLSFDSYRAMIAEQIAAESTVHVSVLVSTVEKAALMRVLAGL